MNELMEPPRERGGWSTPSRFKIGWLVVFILAGGFTVLLLLPTHDGPQESPDRAVCRSNLRQIWIACGMYADYNNESFPDRLERLYPEYADEPEIFSCPSAPSDWKDFKKGKVTARSSSYVLVPGLKATMPSDTILAYDKSAKIHRGDGRCVALVGGYAGWMREKKFQEKLKKQRAALAKLKAAGK